MFSFARWHIFPPSSPFYSFFSSSSVVMNDIQEVEANLWYHTQAEGDMPKEDPTHNSVMNFLLNKCTCTNMIPKNHMDH